MTINKRVVEAIRKIDNEDIEDIEEVYRLLRNGCWCVPCEDCPIHKISCEDADRVREILCAEVLRDRPRPLYTMTTNDMFVAQVAPQEKT